MELREILAHLKSENGLTTDMLSARSGVPKGTLNKLLNGETRNPTGATLQKLANALGCSVHTLCTGARDVPVAHGIINEQDILPIERHPIPLLGEIAAGTPIYAEEQADYVSCGDTIRADFALRVRGDSMTGARIQNGDIVFIRTQEDVDDGEIAAVIIGDEATLKRVYHIKNGLQLLSENPKYPPMLFTMDNCESIRILGKAVGFQSAI